MIRLYLPSEEELRAEVERERERMERYGVDIGPNAAVSLKVAEWLGKISS